jgi:ribosomal protein S18 acetylase RimI-like enzyme
VDLAEWEWRSARGIYSYRMSHVVRSEAGLLGLLISYSAHRYRKIDWSFGSSRPHLDASQWERITGAYKLAAFLFPAIPDDAYYVQNVAIHPATRGQGLGRQLMEFAFELGRSEGCRSCHLDVDSSTPAVQFYERLGMRVLVKTEIPSIRGVQAHYRMVREL